MFSILTCSLSDLDSIQEDIAIFTAMQGATRTIDHQRFVQMTKFRI